MKTRKDNRPPKHEQTRRRGETRADGLVFWAYHPNCRNGEWWVTPEIFASRDAASRKATARYRQTEKGRATNQRCYTEYRRTGRHIDGKRRRFSCLYSTAEGKAEYAVRNATRRAAKYAGQNKPSRSFELLGTDLETFKAHIEAQFTEGMSWENHGEWHIDHTIPLASGKTPEEIWKLCHYTNLQPLWALDNIRKGAKILEDCA